MKLLLFIQVLLLGLPALASNDDLKTREDFRNCREKIQAEIVTENASLAAHKARAQFSEKNLEKTKKQIDDLDEEYEKELDQYFEDHLDLNPKSKEFQSGMEKIRRKMIEKRNDLKRKHLSDVNDFEFKSQ